MNTNQIIGPKRNHFMSLTGPVYEDVYTTPFTDSGPTPHLPMMSVWAESNSISGWPLELAAFGLN